MCAKCEGDRNNRFLEYFWKGTNDLLTSVTLNPENLKVDSLLCLVLEVMCARYEDDKLNSFKESA